LAFTEKIEELAFMKKIEELAFMEKIEELAFMENWLQVKSNIDSDKKAN